MTEYLRFSDPQTLADLKSFVQRAKALNDAGIRLQSVNSTLAAWVGVMHGPLGSGVPTMIGMRAVPIGPSDDVDVVVAHQSLLDRFARMDEAAVELAVPPSIVDVPWAGIAPPRSGWEAVLRTNVRSVRAMAAQVAQTMATTLPETPGQAVVNSLRHRVWSETVRLGELDVPQGAAFAADALGFVSGDETHDVTVFQAERWLRLSAPFGHVLVRR